MKDDFLTYEIKVNVNMPFEIIRYFEDFFKGTFNNILRYYSIHYILKKDNKSMISQDYYYLSIINLRKLFEPKMRTTYKIKSDTTKPFYPQKDHQLNFIQWINRYYKMFNIGNYHNDINAKNEYYIKKSYNSLKKLLQKFEGINNAKEVFDDGVNRVIPLKDRIYNYASWFVAHATPGSSISRWEYNNEAFPEDEEIESLVLLISDIQDKFYNLFYYWSNVVEVKEKDYSVSFEQKMQNYFKDFIKELT